MAAKGYQNSDQIVSISEGVQTCQFYMVVKRNKKNEGDTAVIYKLNSELTLVSFADGSAEPREVDWELFKQISGSLVSAEEA